MNKHECSVREAAEHSHYSKSTIHLDVTERLKEIDTKLYYKVQDVLKYNNAIKGFRGAEAAWKHKKINWKKQRPSKKDILQTL